MRTAFLTVALLFSIGCASMGSHPTNLAVPLVYRPTSHLSSTASLATTRSVFIAPVIDERPEKANVGENIEDDGAPARTVTTSGATIPDFVHDAFRRELANAGVVLTDDAASADHTLTVTLRRLFCTESNTYRTDASAGIAVSGRGASFSGAYTGRNTRFGRSYSPGNYQETLSDALVDLIDNMLKDPAFRAALNP